MSAYDTAVLADNPVGYWPLGELSGTTAADLSVNNLPGTYTGSAVLGQTPLASQLNDSVNLPTTAGMTTQTNVLYGLTPLEFAVEAWIKPSALGGFQEAISSASGAGFRMLCTNNTLWFLVGGAAAITSGNVLTNGVAHHVVMVMDSSAGLSTLYLDGVSILTGGLEALPGGPTPIFIGSLDGAGSQQYLGNISNVAVYNYALTAVQVLAHYTAGTVAPTTVTNSVAQGALQYAGQTGSLNIAAVYGQPITTPANPFTFITKRLPTLSQDIFDGLFVGFEASGKGYYFGTQATNLYVITQLTYGGSGAAAVFTGGISSANFNTWLQLNWDGTDFNFAYSFDGTQFDTVYSVPLATFMTTTPDTIGLFYAGVATADLTNQGAFAYFRRTL